MSLLPCAHLWCCQPAERSKQHHVAGVQPQLLRGAGLVLFYGCAISIELDHLPADKQLQSQSAVVFQYTAATPFSLDLGCA